MPTEKSGLNAFQQWNAESLSFGVALPLCLQTPFYQLRWGFRTQRNSSVAHCFCRHSLRTSSSVKYPAHEHNFLLQHILMYLGCYFRVRVTLPVPSSQVLGSDRCQDQHPAAFACGRCTCVHSGNFSAHPESLNLDNRIFRSRIDIEMYNRYRIILVAVQLCLSQQILIIQGKPDLSAA